MKKILSLFSIFLLALFLTGSARAYTSNTLLAEAQPDECFAGVGVDYPPPSSLNPFTCPNIADPNNPSYAVYALPKTNQTYVWGLTRIGNSLWFGTGGNVACTTAGMFVDTETLTVSSTGVCEYGESQVARTNPLVKPEVGDVRPPKIYEYDLTTRTLIDRTPNDPLINQSMGLRSAGSFNGVVFLAGGSLRGPVIMFAFDADTKQYLGSRTFRRYATIRKWIIVNNRLYTAMGTQMQPGNILRWAGSRTNPWNFIVVGTVEGVPREIAQYIDGSGQIRIAAFAQNLYVSPPLNAQGVLPYSTATWKLIWRPQYYEPDLMVSTAYGGGATVQYDGWLYFGTVHVPARAAEVHRSCTFTPLCFGEPQTTAEETTLFNGTWRATSVWRARNLEGTNPEIQLLYGETQLPTYNPSTRTFDLTPNVGGYVPLYGTSGFGNPGNSYSWTMAAAAGKLFVGTLDLSSADLWYFESSDLPAILDDGSGLGDSRNYGIRTMVPGADGNTLYCGMATSSNLQGTSTTTKPGWELRELIFSPVRSPRISPTGGIFVDPVTVSMSVTTPGETIRYTLDGTVPTESSTLYESPFTLTLTGTTTVKAKGFIDGTSSDVVTVSFSKAKVSTPAMDPNGGSFASGPVTVTITDSTTGALIYYTLDGTEPTESSPLYTSPLVLTETKTVKAKAFLANYLSSSTRTRTFTIGQVIAPVITPPGGPFTNSVTVSLSSSSSGAAIHYTVDGTEPIESSPLYLFPIVVYDTITLKAQGYLIDLLPSATTNATFTETPAP